MLVTSSFSARLGSDMSSETFIQLIKPVQQKMYRLALRLLRDPAAAQDAVQDVSLKLWRQRQDLDEIRNLEAWCMRLARNRCLDILRSVARKTDDLEHHPEECDREPLPDGRAEQQDLMLQIRLLMDQLPEPQKLTMHLRDIEGYTYQQIADTLGLSLAQVKINLFRARKSVRTQIIKTTSYGL